MVISKLKYVIDDIEQAAREIYYAKSLLEPNHPARANLALALNALGIKSPLEVGLSHRIEKDNISDRNMP